MLLDRELLKKTGVFALVSGEVLASVGLFFFLGKYLDEKFQTAPWIKSFLVLLGFGYSIWRIKKLSQKWL